MMSCVDMEGANNFDDVIRNPAFLTRGAEFERLDINDIFLYTGFDSHFIKVQ